MELDQKRQAILKAMYFLPAEVSVPQVSEKVGEELTVRDFRVLTALGLALETEADTPPAIRFTLTPRGRKLAKEMMPLRERVSREDLAQAINEGRSLEWMSLRLDASVQGIRELLEEYGLYPINPPTATQAQSSGRKRRRYNWPSDADLVRRAQEIADSGGSVTAVLTAEIGCDSGRLWQRIGDARERLGLPRQMRTTDSPGDDNEVKEPPAQLQDALLPDDEAAQGDDTTPQPTEPPAAATVNESTVRIEVQESEHGTAVVREHTSPEAEIRRALERRVRELELANREQQKTIEQLRSEKAAIAATLERYVQEQAEQRNVMAVLLYVGEDGSVEHSLLTADCRPVDPGDELAREKPGPNGRWRVEVWHCTDMVKPRGMVPICVMRPGPAPTAEQEQKEAA